MRPGAAGMARREEARCSGLRACGAMRGSEPRKGRGGGTERSDGLNSGGQLCKYHFKNTHTHTPRNKTTPHPQDRPTDTRPVPHPTSDDIASAPAAPQGGVADAPAHRLRRAERAKLYSIRKRTTTPTCSCKRPCLRNLPPSTARRLAWTMARARLTAKQIASCHKVLSTTERSSSATASSRKACCVEILGDHLSSRPQSWTTTRRTTRQTKL